MVAGGNIARHGRGPGRPPGTPNKVPAAVKEMVLEALANKGGVKYLEKQADENPKAFLALVGKVIPLDLTANGNLTVEIVRFCD